MTSSHQSDAASSSSAAAVNVPMSDMSRSLSDELDRRCQQWQTDVTRMQHDFFKV